MSRLPAPIQPIADIPDALKEFGVSKPFALPSLLSQNTLAVPSVFLVAVVVYAIGWFIMSSTAFGRRVYAVGANPTAALAWPSRHGFWPLGRGSASLIGTLKPLLWPMPPSVPTF